MYIPHVLFFFGTKDGRVPSVEVKGLKIDPSEFSTPFPGARISIPKGCICTPFTYYYAKKGADFSGFVSHFFLPYPWYIIKGGRKEKKRKEDFKEKNQNCTFPKPEGPVDRLYGASWISEGTWAGEGQKITSPLQRVC